MKSVIFLSVFRCIEHAHWPNRKSELSKNNKSVFQLKNQRLYTKQNDESNTLVQICIVNNTKDYRESFIVDKSLPQYLAKSH